MFKHKIKNLSLVENGSLVGLISLTDLIRSPEVTEWLEEFPLKETPRRMKMVIDVYFDPMRRLRKRCPPHNTGRCFDKLPRTHVCGGWKTNVLFLS